MNLLGYVFSLVLGRRPRYHSSRLRVRTSALPPLKISISSSRRSTKRFGYIIFYRSFLFLFFSLFLSSFLFFSISIFHLFALSHSSTSMKLSVLFPCYAVSLLVGLSTAITLPTRRDASSLAVVGIPIQRKVVQASKNGLNHREAARKLQRRVVSDEIENRVSLLTYA